MMALVPGNPDAVRQHFNLCRLVPGRKGGVTGQDRPGQGPRGAAAMHSTAQRLSLHVTRAAPYVCAATRACAPSPSTCSDRCITFDGIVKAVAAAAGKEAKVSRQCCSRAQPVCSTSAAALFCCVCHRAACRAAGKKVNSITRWAGQPS